MLRLCGPERDRATSEHAREVLLLRTRLQEAEAGTATGSADAQRLTGALTVAKQEVKALTQTLQQAEIDVSTMRPISCIPECLQLQCVCVCVQLKEVSMKRQQLAVQCCQTLRHFPGVTLQTTEDDGIIIRTLQVWHCLSGVPRLSLVCQCVPLVATLWCPVMRDCNFMVADACVCDTACAYVCRSVR